MKKFSTDRDKLEQILKFSMLDKAKLGRKIGVDNQKLYQITNGKQSEFSRGTMVKLVKIFPEISPYWLITGEGSMLSGSIEHHNAVANDHSKAMYYAGQQTATENQSVAVFLLANPLAKHCYLGILTALSAVVVRILRRRTS